MNGFAGSAELSLRYQRRQLRLRKQSLLRMHPARKMSKLISKLRKRNKGYLIYIDDVQYLNILWVIASFTLLYYGVTGDGQDMINAFMFIIYFFLLFWYLGIREKKKQFEQEEIPGTKVLDQWSHLVKK